MKKAILFLVGSLLFLQDLRAQDTLRVGYNEDPPFIIKNDLILEGITIWLWQKISEDTDIPHKLIKMSLDSVLNNLATKQIDLAISPLTITAKRSKVMDFTSPYFITHSGILTKTSSDKTQFAILNAIWSWRFIKSLGALIIVICFFGGALWFFERRKNKDQFGHGLKGLGNGIWWSAVTMTTVGYGDTTPKTPIGKSIAVIWMFVAIMIISGFTASITSSLTINNLATAETNVMTYKNKSIGTLNESATESWLKNHFFSNLHSYRSIEEAMAALNNGQIIAIAYGAPMLKYLAHKNTKEKYTLQNIKYNHQMYSFGISENMSDETKEKIEYALLNITNTNDWKVILNTYGLLNSDNE